jgi:hypothetical protein
MPKREAFTGKVTINTVYATLITITAMTTPYITKTTSEKLITQRNQIQKTQYKREKPSRRKSRQISTNR